MRKPCQSTHLWNRGGGRSGHLTAAMVSRSPGGPASTISATQARAWEPKRLRYCLLHVAGRVCRGGRRLRLRLDRHWRWAGLLCAAFARVRALPAIL